MQGLVGWLSIDKLISKNIFSNNIKFENMNVDEHLEIANFLMEKVI